MKELQAKLERAERGLSDSIRYGMWELAIDNSKSNDRNSAH